MMITSPHGSGLRALGGAVTLDPLDSGLAAGGVIMPTMTPKPPLAGFDSEPIELESVIHVESQPVPNPLPGGV
jgi:hypothetical protein